MVKHSWCVLCVTLVVAGCSSESSNETSFQENDAVDLRLGSFSADDSELGDAAPMPIGDECGTPALLSNQASSRAHNIDEAIDSSDPSAWNQDETAATETETAELSPPVFVPPLTIAAMSRAQAAAESTESSGVTEAPAVTETIEVSAPASETELPVLEVAQTTDPFAVSAPAPASPAIPLEVEQQAAPSVEVSNAFASLIAEDGTLADWDIVDGKLEAWQIDNGVLRCVGSGGGWLQTSAAYSDFVLRGEYRLSAGANTGIAIRFPGEGNPSSTGIEVQLLDETAEKYADVRDMQRTGSLYYLSAASAPAIPHPVGEWNAIEIICRGRHIQVKLNGLLVNDVAIDPLDSTVAGQRLSSRAPLGHIALQSYDTPVEFRGLEVRDLTRETESGLRIVDVQEGTGEAAQPGMDVTVHYIGQFLSGEIFDDSYSRDEAVTVPIDRVIPGWREGIRGMQVGGRRRLIVPPQLAYGESGVDEIIPGNSTLVFEVELLAVATVEDVVAQPEPVDSTEAATTESVAAPQDAVEESVAPPASSAPSAATEVSSPFLAPPTREAALSRQMTDPLIDSSLFDQETASEPNTLPASAITPASSIQSGSPLPVHAPQGPRF